MKTPYLVLALTAFLSIPTWAVRQKADLGVSDPVARPPEKAAPERQYKNDGSIEDLILHREKKQKALKAINSLIGGPNGTVNADSGGDSGFSSFDALDSPSGGGDFSAQGGQCENYPSHPAFPYLCKLLSRQYMNQTNQKYWGLRNWQALAAFELVLFLLFSTIRVGRILKMDTLRLARYYLWDSIGLGIYLVLAIVVLPGFTVSGSWSGPVMALLRSFT